MNLDWESYEAGRSFFNELIASFSDPAYHSSSYSGCYGDSTCKEYLYELFLKGGFENGEIICASRERECSYNPKHLDKECLRCFVETTKSLQEKYPCYSYEFYSNYDSYNLLQSYINLEEDKSKVPDDVKTDHSPIFGITGNDEFYDDFFDVSNSQNVTAIYEFLPYFRVPFFEDVVFDTDLNIKSFTITRNEYLLSQVSVSERGQWPFGKDLLPSSAQEAINEVEGVFNLRTFPSVYSALDASVTERMSNRILGKFELSSVFWRLGGLAVWDFVMEYERSKGDNRPQGKLCTDFDEKIQALFYGLSQDGYKSSKFDEIKSSNDTEGFAKNHFSKTKSAIDKWKKQFYGKSFCEF